METKMDTTIVYCCRCLLLRAVEAFAVWLPGKYCIRLLEGRKGKAGDDSTKTGPGKGL